MKGFRWMRNPGDHERLRLKRYDGGYGGRDPTGCEIIWRSGVEMRKKAMMKSETKKMEQEGAEDERMTEHEEVERKKGDDE